MSERLISRLPTLVRARAVITHLHIRILVRVAVAAEGLGIELRNTGFCALYIYTKPLGADRCPLPAANEGGITSTLAPLRSIDRNEPGS